MHTIRHLIIDFIFITTLCFSLGLFATESSLTESSTILSQEMCMDELFQIDAANYDQSVLRTSYTDNGVEVKYEVVVTSTGEAYILKDNSLQVKTLSYTSGDYFSAKLLPTVLEIYQNTTLVFSQAITATTSYQTSSAVIEDKLNLIDIDFIRGYCDNAGVLEKCEANGWGNAGFVSKNILKLSEDGKMSFIVAQTDKRQMIGLGSSIPDDYSELNYALYIYTDQRLRVYENGTRKVLGSSLSVGDKLSIEKIGDCIKYYHNNALIYTSSILVNQDFNLVGSTHDIGTVMPEIYASFKEDHQLYTTATVSKITDQIKWNRLSHYNYSPTYKGMVSTSETPSALSENYYYGDAGHKAVTITPDLSKLFTPENRERDLNVIIGIKEFKEGNYFESDISYDQALYSLSFEGKNDGTKRLHILEGGSPRASLNGGYDNGDVFKITLDDGRLIIYKEENGRDTPIYTGSIDSGKRYVVYQGSRFQDSPFIGVNINGFEATGFVNYAYQYDGEDELLKKFDGNVQQVLTATGQTDILHQIGWHNLSNIKGYNSNVTIRKALEQENTGTVASGESAFRFNPTDEFKLSFIYSGGEYSIGSKSLLSSALNPMISGFNISGGNISLVNNGSNSNTISINSGANVTMVFNGNSTMTLQVNGATIGSPVDLPASVLNLGINLNQGTIQNSFSASAVSIPQAPAAAAMVNVVHDIFQGNYLSDCLAPGDLEFRLQPVVTGDYLIRIYDFDVNSTIPIYEPSSPIHVSNTSQTYIHAIPTALLPGVYRYNLLYPNGVVENRYFSVGTPIQWNENNSNAFNVDFIETDYLNIPSLSTIIPVGGGAYSESYNEVTTDKSFAQTLPILLGVNGEYEMEVTDGSNEIARTKIISSGTSAVVECYINGSTTPYATFPVFQNGNIEQVFVMAAPGIYKIGWYYSDYGYRELKVNSGVITISSSVVSLGVKWNGVTNIPFKGFEASYCPGTPSSSGIIAKSKLKLYDCAPDRKVWYYHNAMGNYINPYQCPSYSVVFKLENLEPSTAYKVNSFQIVGNVLINSGEIASYGSIGYDFTTNSNGESPGLITINALFSENINDNALKMELLNYASGSPVSELYDFVVTDEYSGITENLINCYSYKTKYYDCFFDEEGDMEVKRELSNFPEVPDYDWSDNSSNESAYNEDLATGCYTVGLGYDFSCGFPEVYLPYKMAAQTIWADVGTNHAGWNPNATYDEPTNNLFNAGGTVSNAVSLNALDYTIDGLIWYRNVYDNMQTGEFGYYNEETGTYFGVSISPNIDPTVDYTHALKVYISNPGTGYHDILNPNFINLNQFEFIEFKKENINGTDETGGINLVLNIYPEFSTTSGEVTPRNTYTFSTEQLTTKSYQLFASPSLNNKLGEFGLNFCPPPIDKYFALMSRSLHDGRHELKTCLSKDGYSECPMEIKNDCGLIDGVDLLNFKFDEDYYRSLSPTEILNFEVRDYQDNIVVSSVSGLANTLVKLGDNRYQLSMSTLNSIHPFYTLIVKNAKDEKRYLRFKK